MDGIVEYPSKKRSGIIITHPLSTPLSTISIVMQEEADRVLGFVRLDGV